MIKVTVVLGLAATMFAIVLSMRTGHFWVYIVAALGCWAVVIWTGHRRDANHGGSLFLSSRYVEIARSAAWLRHGLEVLGLSPIHGSGNRTMNSLPCAGPSLWASTRPP